MTFDELCKLDDYLLALYQEAGAFRVLFEDGRPGRTFSAERAAKLRRDPNFCKQQLWRGLPGKNGEVGLLYQMNQCVGWGAPESAPPELHSSDAYDICYHTIHNAIPPCQHYGESCKLDYGPLLDTQPCAICGSTVLGADVEQAKDKTTWTCQCGARRESLKRYTGEEGFASLQERIQAAIEKQKPKVLDMRAIDDLAEPVFIVDSSDSGWRLQLDLKFRERFEAREISRWYAREAIYVCDAATRKLVLSKKLTKDSVCGALSWKPVVLTFTDEALERKLATVCTQVLTVLPDKNGCWHLDLVHSAVKEIAPALNLEVPDMPAEVLDGWLGEICRKHMAGFPIAYAWPALLVAGSVLVPQLPGNVRSNLYVGLIGSVGTGKTSAFERAFWLLQVAKPLLENLKSGSGEGMAEFLGDLQGAKRLVFVNELAHLLAKVNYQGSTFEQFLNDAYYQNQQTLTIARGRKIVFDCCMSLAGGLPEDKFEELFGVGTIGGFHDRAIFGVCPTKFAPFAQSSRPSGSPTPTSHNKWIAGCCSTGKPGSAFGIWSRPQGVQTAERRRERASWCTSFTMSKLVPRSCQ